MPIQCDLTSESDVANLFETTVSKFGTIDVVIACAASRSQMKKIGETDIAGWWNDFVSSVYIRLACQERGEINSLSAQETNVKGLYLLTRHAVNVKSEGPITFINVTSSMAIETIPTRSNYGITKSAGCKLIEYLHAGR